DAQRDAARDAFKDDEEKKDRAIEITISPAS
ncbi:MAG: hypothetical protein K0R17_4063, partial [Rariglobus sp.]|nr:hypothetical protein [Rariglobus sp.]